MKIVRSIGGAFVVIGVLVFTASMFLVSFNLDQEQFDSFVSSHGYQDHGFVELMNQHVVGNDFSSVFSFSSEIASCLEESNAVYIEAEEWGE